VLWSRYLKQGEDGRTDQADDNQQRDERGQQTASPSPGSVGRMVGYWVVKFPRLVHRNTAPCWVSAAAIAAKRASEASSAVSVRSAARNRRLKASDFLPSSIPVPV